MFDTLNLHDSKLMTLDLAFDEAKGELLTISLDYIESYDSHQYSKRKLTFVDCREIHLVGHLGYSSGHSIDDGGEIQKSELLIETRRKWENIGGNGALWKHFYIRATSGSRIDIIAEDCLFE